MSGPGAGERTTWIVMLGNSQGPARGVAVEAVSFRDAMIAVLGIDTGPVEIASAERHTCSDEHCSVHRLPKNQMFSPESVLIAALEDAREKLAGAAGHH